MKEIRAYVHRSRVADVIAALKGSPAWADAAGGEHNLAAHVVKGLLLPLDALERRYSMDLGDEVINEYKLEFLCADDKVEEFVKLIRDAARTGQSTAGWIVVANVDRAVPIV